MLPSIQRLSSEQSPAIIGVVTIYPSPAIVVSLDAGSESLFRYLHLFDADTFGADPAEESLSSIPDIEVMVGQRTGRLYEITFNWRAGLFQRAVQSVFCDEHAEDYCTPELDMDSAWPEISTGKICRANVPISAAWSKDGALIIRVGDEMEGRWLQPDRDVAIFISSKGTFAGLVARQPGLRDAVRAAAMP